MTKMKLYFLRIFDNPFTKYLTQNGVSYLDWLFWSIDVNEMDV